MFVKPKDGVSVRDPVKGSALPTDGAEVPENIFWQRRLIDGDVYRVEPTTTKVTGLKTAKKSEGVE